MSVDKRERESEGRNPLRAAHLAVVAVVILASGVLAVAFIVATGNAGP